MGNQFSKRAETGVRDEVERPTFKQLFEFLRRRGEEWKTQPITFGLIGESGTGKSSYINTVRELNPGDPGAAAVGVIETTTEPTEYSHPSHPLLTFWDLPGVGTRNFPRETYLKRINFEKYDFYLIMSKDRFTENDHWLAQEIKKRGKQFFFLRTKFDQDIANDRRDSGDTHDPERVMQSIKANIRSNLGNLYDEDSVFFINNHDRHAYDFERLGERLVEAFKKFPEVKRTAFILSMSAMSESMVKSKIDTLRALTIPSAALSGLAAAAPVPGVSLVADGAILVALCQMYFKTLGLDEVSMNQRSKFVQCDFGRLNQIVASARCKYFAANIISTLIRMSPILIAGELAEQTARWVPIFGQILAGAISAGSMLYILNRILDELKEIALEVVRAEVSEAIGERRGGNHGNQNQGAGV